MSTSQKNGPEQEFEFTLRKLEEELRSVKQLNRRFERLAFLLEEHRIGDVLRNYMYPRRVFAINFLAGLARGLGLTVGTAIVLAIAGYLLGKFITIPVIGEYISDILDYVNLYRMNR